MRFFSGDASSLDADLLAAAAIAPLLHALA